MSKLSGAAGKTLVGLVVAAIFAVGAYFVVFDSTKTTTVTARFASAVGIYEDTPVRILGVNVGEVTSIKPGPQYVAVTLQYDAKYHIRAKDASAVEVANSLVSDRYINLSTLIGKNDHSPILKNNSVIPLSRTGGPAELDEIYAQLDRLSVALGPQGANKGGAKSGALSTLLSVSAANLKGNGAALGQSIGNLAAAARTLSDHRNGLFGTVKNLQKFTTTLKSSDAQVRLFNDQLAEVAGDLADERGDLGSALKLLGVALDEVSTFVKGNAAKFHIDITGLRNITRLLVNQKASIQETLAVAPVALANLVHSYSPSQGSLGTRSNLVSLTNISGGDVLGTICTDLGGLSSVPGVGSILGGLSKVCKTVTKSTSSTGTSSKASAAITRQGSSLIDTLLNGGVPAGTLIGSGS